MSGKDVAIVTAIPGTTRDILREYVVIDGMPMHIIDTAGLRESSDVVEQEGIRRAREEIARADVVLFVTDASEPIEYKLQDILYPIPQRASVITIRNKIDLTHTSPEIKNENNQTSIYLSAKQAMELNC